VDDSAAVPIKERRSTTMMATGTVPADISRDRSMLTYMMRKGLIKMVGYKFR